MIDKKIGIPERVILIPYFWDQAYYKSLREKALKRLHVAHTEIVVFENVALVVGFLGYSNILTVLEFIADIRKKEIFFLGTAGSLTDTITRPQAYNVTRIFSSSIFKRFSRRNSLGLQSLNNKNFPAVKGVSVDLIQRETASWLKKQTSLGIDIVEMEIFPLRTYLKKYFTALVVTTDRVLPGKVDVFPDKKKVKQEFIRSFEFIINL